MQRRRPGEWVRLAVAAAIALALSGCSHVDGTSRVRPEPGELPGIAGRDCRLAHPLGSSPSLNELARAGTRGNIALWGRGMIEADTVELSVRYADDAQLFWVETMRSTVPQDRTLALETLVFDALDAREQPDWGVRLLIVGGSVERVLPSVICEPEPRAAGSIQPNIEAIREYYRVEGYRVPVRIELDERGNVLDVRLLRRTYSRAIDQYLRSYIWDTSFEPKLHDGIGLPSTLELNIEFPRRRR